MSANLQTTYLGLTLPTPIVASASPLTGRLDTLRELADAGAGAVVLPSLLEEDIAQESDSAADRLWHEEEHAGAARAYLPAEGVGIHALDAYLDFVREASAALDIPVIASLNGSTPGGWTNMAQLLQHAGADAVELNVYGVESDLYTSSAAIEDRLVRLVRSVRNVISVPLAVKLSPFYTAFGHVARDLSDTCDGLVLFNRFYQPNVDLASLEIVPELHLSTREEIRLPLRWIAILRGRVPVSLAATTGIHTGEDALKAILVGADVAMMASTLLLHGPGRVRDSLTSLAAWLDLHKLPSADAARGRLSQEACADPRAFERAQYVRTIRSVDPVAAG